MSSVVIAGNTSGTITLDAPNVAGTTTLTLPTANGTIVSANSSNIISVSGVQFPATQSVSADANTLDDYEEGSWTPSIGSLSSGSLTYITQAGTYTKIGHLVSVQGWIRINTISSPVSTSLSLNGLPFTSDSNSTRASIAFRATGLASVTGIVGLWMNDASTTANLVALNNGSASALLGSNLASNGEFDFSFSYRASA
jgi:hypothetical protein